jgi:hypothetical protein
VLWTSLIFLIPILRNYIIFSVVGAFQEVWKYFYKFVFSIYLLRLKLLHGITGMLGAARGEEEWGGRVQGVT